jgi:hypothetical protein
MLINRFRLAAAALVLIATSCTTLQVATDFNPEFDFGKLKTYAWEPQESAPAGDVRIDNALVNDRVVSAVDVQLAEKGYRMNRAAPDFYVAWLGAIDRKLRIDAINDFHDPYGYGSYRCCWPYNVRTYVSEYDVGILIIDILSASDRKLVWRGSAKDYLSESGTPEEKIRNTSAAVSAILSKFPPSQLDGR